MQQRLRDQCFSLPAAPYLWLVDVLDYYRDLDIIEDFLSSEESERRGKIPNIQMQQLFSLRKGLTRMILADFFQQDPREIQYQYDNVGKPFIDRREFGGYSFNLAHTGRYLLLGIGEEGEIGVDVERVNPSRRTDLMGGTVFSPEELSSYKSYDSSSRLRSFYKTWVQKEAVSKALGLGMALGFTSVTLRSNPRFQAEDYQIQISLERGPLPFHISVREKNDIFLAVAAI